MTEPQDKPERARWSGFQLNAAVFIIALLLSCFAAELVLRAVKLNPYGMPPRRVDILQNGGYIPGTYWGTAYLKRPSPFPGVKMEEYRPDLDFRFVYASNPRNYFDQQNAVAARINSQGTRGAEFSIKKEPGRFRIIGLGDSFTFGEGVRIEDVFLSRLQDMLNLNSAGIHREADGGGRRNELRKIRGHKLRGFRL